MVHSFRFSTGTVNEPLLTTFTRRSTERFWLPSWHSRSHGRRIEQHAGGLAR